jgi:hypothetical protein
MNDEFDYWYGNNKPSKTKEIVQDIKPSINTSGYLGLDNSALTRYKPSYREVPNQSAGLDVFSGDPEFSALNKELINEGLAQSMATKAPSSFMSGLKSTLGNRDLMSGIVGGAGLIMDGLAAYQNNKFMKEQLRDMRYNRSVAEEARNRHTANLEGLGKVGASWSNKGTA